MTAEPTWTPADIRGTPAPGFPKLEGPCLKCRGYGVELIDISTMGDRLPQLLLGSSPCNRCHGAGIELD